VGVEYDRTATACSRITLLVALNWTDGGMQRIRRKRTDMGARFKGGLSAVDLRGNELSTVDLSRKGRFDSD
jgi:hypothetical protein